MEAENVIQSEPNNIQIPAVGSIEPTTWRLSDLDESRAYGERWTCTHALNASVTLRHSDGSTEEFTDLCSSYGAVNFGHCNEDIRLPAHPSVDLVAGIYPPEAERFAAWLTDTLDVNGFKVLFQIGGSFAVTAALALSGAAMADVISTGATFEQTLVNAAAKFPGEIQRGTGISEHRRYSC